MCRCSFRKFESWEFNRYIIGIIFKDIKYDDFKSAKWRF